MSDTAVGSWSELFTRQYAPTVATLCLGVALLAFNSFLAATALPTAVTELHGLALISWATTLYLVFAIMGGAGAALVKQAFGARRGLLLFAAVFLVGSLIAATATAMPQVLVGRVIQGTGEGVVAAICYTLIPELFPSRLVPKVFGMNAMMWGIAAFGGPVGVGALTEAISWRAAFFVNVPLVLVFAALVFFVAPRARPAGDMPSFPGIRLLTVGGGILLVALAGIAPPLEASGLLVLAVVLLVSTVFLDRRSRTRLLPTGAFSFHSVIGAGLWVVLLMPISAAAAAVYLVLILEKLWAFGPTLAGGIGALMAIAWSVASITVANIKTPSIRLGLIRVGPGLVALGVLGLVLACFASSIILLVLSQLVLGAGFGIAWSYLSLTLMESSPRAERDRTSALLPTMQSAGNAIGAAIAGLTANLAGFASAVTPDQIRTSIAPSLLLGVLVALIALVLSIRTVSLATKRGGALPAEMAA